MAEFWTNLSEAQATLLAAVITIIGAGLGVLIGWRLLGGKVKDLEDALDRSKVRLEQHELVVTEALETINEQIGAILGGLGQVRGSVEDMQAGASPTVESPAAIGQDLTSDEEAQAAAIEDADLRDALKSSWIAIRDQIDAIAASHPDGRTRAKYGRLYRRNYQPLIDCLEEDGRMNGMATLFGEANTLWQRFQRGRATPTVEEVQRMDALRSVLVPNNGAKF